MRQSKRSFMHKIIIEHAILGFSMLTYTYIFKGSFVFTFFNASRKKYLFHQNFRFPVFLWNYTFWDGLITIQLFLANVCLCVCMCVTKIFEENCSEGGAVITLIMM